MESNDFSWISSLPYDRHNYEIVLKNQKKNIIFTNWEDAQVYWLQHCQIPDFLYVIIVKDKKETKGFGK